MRQCSSAHNITAIVCACNHATGHFKTIQKQYSSLMIGQGRTYKWLIKSACEAGDKAQTQQSVWRYQYFVNG